MWSGRSSQLIERLSEIRAGDLRAHCGHLRVAGVDSAIGDVIEVDGLVAVQVDPRTHVFDADEVVTVYDYVRAD
jgi:hypothetical protein